MSNLQNEELKAEEVNCSYCNDTQDYEGDTCPYCKPNKERENGERAMDFNKGN